MQYNYSIQDIKGAHADMMTRSVASGGRESVPVSVPSVNEVLVARIAAFAS